MATLSPETALNYYKYLLRVKPRRNMVVWSREEIIKTKKEIGLQSESPDVIPNGRRTRGEVRGGGVKRPLIGGKVLVFTM